MTKKTIQFSPPDISEKEIEYVTEVLRSGWITTGPRTKQLERDIAKMVGLPTGETSTNAQSGGQQGASTPNCVCLNSGTAGLEMALRLLGIGEQNGGSKQDEVITCAYTYTATAAVIDHVGATIRLADCSMEPGSIEMDYDSLYKLINENTKAIIAVDLGGIPCDYDRLYEIVESRRKIFKADAEDDGLGEKTCQLAKSIRASLGRIAIIADSAHGFGGAYKGTMNGKLADFSSFSFHAVKNFTTAEGGAFLWKSIDGVDDADIYKRVQLYSLHGQSKDALSKSTAGGWEYDVIGPWYKCNMTDIVAAIGQAQFERYPELLARRREIIKRYDDAFKPLGVEVLDHYNETRTSSGHLYITRLPGLGRSECNEVMAKMTEKGVTTNVHYKPLPLMTAYKNLGFDIKDYPNAYARFVNEITLPLHTNLTDEDVQQVIDSYVEVLNETL